MVAPEILDSADTVTFPWRVEIEGAVYAVDLLRSLPTARLLGVWIAPGGSGGRGSAERSFTSPDRGVDSRRRSVGTVEPGFFEIVRDAFEGFVVGVGGRRNTYVHTAA